MTLHLTCWSFFWGLETPRVLLDALGTQGHLGATLRGVKIFKIMFMFIYLFSSYGTLDILLDVLGALDNAIGVPRLLTFIFSFSFFGLGLDNLSVMLQTLGVMPGVPNVLFGLPDVLLNTS
jgi:hypothetical protein